MKKTPGHPNFDPLKHMVLAMKAGFIRTALGALAVSLAMAGTANAAGCLKGAVVGGVAGHYAGHHAVVGAVGGCIVGRHVAKKHAEEQQAAAQAAPHQQAKMQ
ncbi:outer membrane lipoprotein SlyB [Paraburkholderia atlantica]